MRDVNVLGAELARHALGERAERVLRAGESREARAAAQRRRRAREEDRPATARQHDLGGLAPGEEAGEGGHLPHLRIDAGGGLRDPETDIAADVEDGNLDRTDVALDIREQLHHLLLTASIDREGNGAAALARDRVDESGKLLCGPARHRRDIVLAREAPRDGAAERVARADHESDGRLAGGRWGRLLHGGFLSSVIQFVGNLARAMRPVARGKEPLPPFAVELAVPRNGGLSMKTRIVMAALAAALAFPVTAEAQGVVRGAQQGAYVGNRAAGPVGGAVGGVVGGVTGGVVGGVKGVLGVPQHTGTVRKAYRKKHRMH